MTTFALVHRLSRDADRLADELARVVGGHALHPELGAAVAAAGTPGRLWVDAWLAAATGTALLPQHRQGFAALFDTCAGRGVPLSAVRAAARVAGSWSAGLAWARSDGADVDCVGVLGRAAADRVVALDELAAARYCRHLAHEGARARALLAETLVTGLPHRAAAAALGVSLGGDLLVVLLAGAAGGDGAPVLDRGELAVDDGADRVVLLPAADAGTIGPVRRAAQVEVEAGRAVAVGLARAAGPGAVPAAVAEARTAAAAARGARGVAFLGEVLLEHALQSSGAAPRLAAVLRPIAERDDLLSTLRAFLRHETDQTRTAAALHVQRRTVGYRLDRIAHLTGYDPRTVRGVQVLGGALSLLG